MMAQLAFAMANRDVARHKRCRKGLTGLEGGARAPASNCKQASHPPAFRKSAANRLPAVTVNIIVCINMEEESDVSKGRKPAVVGDNGPTYSRRECEQIPVFGGIYSLSATFELIVMEQIGTGFRQSVAAWTHGIPSLGCSDKPL